METNVKKKEIDFKGKVINIGIEMHENSRRITTLGKGYGDRVYTLIRMREKGQIEGIEAFLPETESSDIEFTILVSLIHIFSFYTHQTPLNICPWVSQAPYQLFA